MNPRIEQIIIKYLNRCSNINELETLELWLRDTENIPIFNKYVEAHFKINLGLNNPDSTTIIKELQNVIQKNKEKKLHTIHTYLKIAAVVFIAVALSASFLYFNKEYFYKNQVVKVKKIQPGTNKAVLTLENGDQVVLKEGKKFTSTNSSVSGEKIVYKKKQIHKKEKIKYNYLTIPRGGQFFATLSDGTKVWLNSDSKLKYPVAFTKNKDRNVELIYGEAYFEVSPSLQNNGTKFNIKTQQQTITVLGTQFNIKAYSDENTITTTLVKGKIKVDYGVKNEILQPNQQAKFNVKNERITITNVDVYDYIAWKKGIFSFKNETLEKITKVLSRWYNVDIIIENNQLKTTTFNGILSKDQKLETILESIHKTNSISYFMNNGKVVLK